MNLPSHPIDVLLIEDSRVARRMIVGSLRDVSRPQYEIRSAETLAEGLALLAENRPDVLLLDLTLADSSGLETCRTVRQHYPTIPIVVLTGTDDESFTNDALKAGAQDFLLKSEMAPTLLSRSLQYAIERKQSEIEREALHRDMIDLSRRAGMSEVASGVLHNVGNVLNSVNVSAKLIASKVRDGKAEQLRRATDLLTAHQDDLSHYVSDDPRGQMVLPYLEQLADTLTREQQTILNELQLLIKNIEHINQIVARQQHLSGVVGAVMPIDLNAVVHEAIQIAQTNHGPCRCAVDYQPSERSRIKTDRSQLLEILVNLITNAMDAVEMVNDEREGLIRIVTDPIGKDAIRIRVTDNGIGITQQRLESIFQHGFTTKPDGHGFGLHASALAAKQMGGSLAASSDGPDKGATFALTLPLDRGGNTVNATVDESSLAGTTS